MTTTPASRSAEARARAASAARLLATVAITLVGLAALTFFIGRVMPVDPVTALVGDQADKETYDAVKERLGLDRPVPIQFAYYLRDIATGDFGTAIATGHPVIEDIRRVFPATLELATLSLIAGVLVGVPLGVAAAVSKGRAVDHAARLFGLFGYSVPHFWLGLIALVVFYAWLGWIGGSGRLSLGYVDAVPNVTGMILVDAILDRNWDVFKDALRHIVAPALILATTSTAYLSRMTRSFMLEQLAQEYVTTARIKGLPEWRVTMHAFRNIGVQLLTIIVLAYGGLLDGAVLTETVFGWPGFGQYLTAGLLAGDMNVVLTCTLLVGLIFLALNLAADVIYRVLDPRTR
ncbi:MAG TPA: ABC transporter permease [Usitatibacter sp.]|nr:ABC transporter permease [Usitatibacter sp.]